MRMRNFVALALMCLGVGGCAQSYTVPGGPADLSALGLTPEMKAAATDTKVQKVQDKKPMVTFPATLAVARVQATQYYDHRQSRYRGNYSLVTVRDVETDADFEKISQLPHLNGAVMMKQILVPPDARSDEELREGAAKLHANLLLYYTFDTQFYTDDRVRALGVVTLGLIPNQKAHAVCTASAVLMDVNNGYIYMVVEATSKDEQLANAWSSEQAMDDVRRKVEREAFEQMVKQFKAEWPVMVATYRTAAR